MDIVKNIQRTHEVLTPAGPVDPRQPRLGGQAFSRWQKARIAFVAVGQSLD